MVVRPYDEENIAMLSITQIECPHCQAKGQMMMPPDNSMMLAGCPKCKEPVIVFLGRALALDKAVLLEGSMEERREHVLGVLTEVLGEGVDLLFSQGALAEEGAAEAASGAPAQGLESCALPRGRRQQNHRGPIAQSEHDQFIETDLDRLDDEAYFRSIFG